MPNDVHANYNNAQSNGLGIGTNANLSIMAQTIQQVDRKKLEEIARTQMKWEHDARLNPSLQNDAPSNACDRTSDAERDQAARMIQKTYRGYRTRRQLNSLNLDASTRWMAAVQEARFRIKTRPLPPPSPPGPDGSTDHGADNQSARSGLDPNLPYATTKSKWQRAVASAQRATSDPSSYSTDTLSSSSSSTSSSGQENRRGSFPGIGNSADHAERRRRRSEERAKQKQQVFAMKIDYFLEMVDPKHRYGSNLRAYHAVWKEADTDQNFFYWLDHGDGRDVELENISRERLEREQVRYLSRAECEHYRVVVDNEGRLCWAKNGARLDTTTAYRDSIEGIVPVDDPTPKFVPASAAAAQELGDKGEESDVVSSTSSTHASGRYPTPEVDKAQGMQKVSKASVATIMNRLLRRTVGKNTWIFVADTKFRLFVGIKQSGSFQHSSFFQGSRISAAGLIKVSDGRLKSLSPLSGHYRPSASSFSAFVSSLRAAGVDISRISISKAEFVLLFLDSYTHTKKKGKRAKGQVGKMVEKVVHPEEARRKAELEEDKSESAAKERAALKASRRRLDLHHPLEKRAGGQEGDTKADRDAKANDQAG